MALFNLPVLFPDVGRAQRPKTQEGRIFYIPKRIS